VEKGCKVVKSSLRKILGKLTSLMPSFSEVLRIVVVFFFDGDVGFGVFFDARAKILLTAMALRVIALPFVAFTPRGRVGRLPLQDASAASS